LSTLLLTELPLPQDMLDQVESHLKVYKWQVKYTELNETASFK